MNLKDTKEQGKNKGCQLAAAIANLKFSKLEL